MTGTQPKGDPGAGSGRSLTNVAWLPVLAIGLVLALVVYFGAELLRPAAAAVGSPVLDYAFSVLYDRGIIQVLSACTFSVLLVGLAAKRRVLGWQQHALDRPWLVEEASSIDAAQAAGLLAHMRDEEPDPALRRSLVVPYRVEQALQRVHMTSSTTGVNELLESLSSADEAVVVNSFAPFQFMLYVLPVLGFIGTVMGVGRSIFSFASLMSGSATEGATFAVTSADLSFIAGQLGVAFDTTLLALVLAAIGVLLTTVQRKREEDFLTRVDLYCIEHVLNRIREDDPAIGQLREALREVPERISPLMSAIDHEVRQMGDALSRFADEMRELATRTAAQTEEAVAEIRRIGERLELSAPDWLSDLRAHMTGFAEAVMELERAGQTLVPLANAVDQAASRFQGAGGDVAGQVGQLAGSVEALRAAVEDAAPSRELLDGLGQRVDEQVELLRRLEAKEAWERLAAQDPGQIVARMDRALEDTSALRTQLGQMTAALEHLARADRGAGDLAGIDAQLGELRALGERMVELESALQQWTGKLLVMLLEAVQDQGIRIVQSSRDEARAERAQWLAQRGIEGGATHG